MSLLYIDIETVSLQVRGDHVWEIGWAFDDEPVESIRVMHTLIGADPKALEVNNYWENAVGFAAYESIPKEAELLQRIKNEKPTLVGANPAFDAYRLQDRWGCAPWHYRLCDVQNMAYGLLPYPEVPSLYITALGLIEHGHEIPMPNHTAAGDVETTRAVYSALMEERNNPK